MRKDQTPKDLDTLYTQAQQAKARLLPEWFLNIAYFEGGPHQWLTWGGGMLVRPDMPKHRITITDNRIQPCVRTELAKLTKNRPVFTVTPRTGDEEDRNAAELGEQLMRFLWEDLNMLELDYKALEWSRVCCAGFLKAFWDPTVGESTEVLMDSGGNILTDQNGRRMTPGSLGGQVPEGIVVRDVRQGNMRVEVRSPFQMFVDPLCDSFPEAEWVIEESIKSADYVYNRYGVTIEPDAPANPGLIASRMGANLGQQGSYKGVKVREYWCKPNKQHPNGFRHVVATSGGDKKTGGGQTLYQDDSPFDPMPYVMYSGIQVPGRLWPTSIVEQLRGPQTELNKVKSQLAENRNRIANPTGIASKQAVQDPEKFLDSISQPGGWYFFDDIGSPNSVPQYLQTPQMPAYVTEQIPMIEESIQEISGQHEVSSGQVPPGVTAASAIAQLLEADDTRLGPAITDHEVQLGRLGSKLLKLAARYYTDARAIRIAGDNGDWQIKDFRGTMLRDNTQVQVQAGSSFPQSKAIKQAWVKDMLTYFAQSGNAPHGRQLAQWLRDAQIGGAEALVEEWTIDEQQCNRENNLLLAGTPLDINSFDNNEYHIENHSDVQKSARYRDASPLAQKMMDMHVAAHRMQVQEAQQQVMNAQLAAQGQAPEGQQLQLAGMAQDQASQAAQAQQQLQGAAQQQGFSQAAQEQDQRQKAAQHEQQMAHARERHQAQMHREAQAHEVRMRQLQQPAGRSR